MGSDSESPQKSKSKPAAGHVYKLQRTETSMLVIVVGVRADEEVYELAEKRVQKYRLDR